MLFYRYRDREAVPRPVDLKCPTVAQFYSLLFQNPSRVAVTCYGPVATLLDYVGGLLSEMDDGLFLLSCGRGGGDGEVGDSGEDGGGVEQGVGERTKSTRKKKGQNKSVSWGGETQAVSHEKTSLEGILKRSHVAKPREQKICKEQG